MALLVTIGNICILGNFQLGIWGISGVPIYNSTCAVGNCKHKKNSMPSTKFR